MLLASAVAISGLGVFGFATITLGAAIVGETRRVDVGKAADAGIDALKAQYKRPATIPFPKENPYTPDKASLGKKLYFDTRISVTSAQSCGSCHSPGFGWADGLAVGVGHGMNKLGRHSPTVVNAAWGGIFMWDGRLATLEEQALGPIQAAGEMNMPLDQLMQRLASIPEYKPMFEAAFPGEGMSAKTLAKAIATYERTIVSERAPFDAWIEGNEKAISEEAKRGFVLFNGKTNCFACHSGWRFTDDRFHDIGSSTTDLGRGREVKDDELMRFAFKTPTLRSVSLRPPYMHNGSFANLHDVMRHYEKGGIDRPSRSPLMLALDLTDQERSDVVAFMETLTGGAETAHARGGAR
jgi:cytochrome c peroxidase